MAKWSDEDKKLCGEYWGMGLSGVEIAEKLGKNPKSIPGIVKSNGFTRGNEFIKPVERCRGLHG